MDTRGGGEEWEVRERIEGSKEEKNSIKFNLKNHTRKMYCSPYVIN